MSLLGDALCGSDIVSGFFRLRAGFALGMPDLILQACATHGRLYKFRFVLHLGGRRLVLMLR